MAGSNVPIKHTNPELKGVDKMRVNSVSLVFLLASTTAHSAFPHKSAIYTMTMSGPMVEVVTDAYVYFGGKEDSAISAEWVTQQTPAGKTRNLNITKQGFVYAIDLDKQHCTKTNIKIITESITDPEAFAKSMKQQMNMQEVGSCEGAGLKGVKYKSSFGEICLYKDMFMLWQNAMGTKTQVTKVKFDTSLPKDKTSIPSGIKCVEGPDLSKGWQGMQQYQGESSSSDADEPPPQDVEEAMQKAREAMKSLGDMVK